MGPAMAPMVLRFFHHPLDEGEMQLTWGYVPFSTSCANSDLNRVQHERPLSEEEFHELEELLHELEMAMMENLQAIAQ